MILATTGIYPIPAEDLQHAIAAQNRCKPHSLALPPSQFHESIQCESARHLLLEKECEEYI
jgi:hypothetical protein